jgi:hypothetical protein
MSDEYGSKGLERVVSRTVSAAFAAIGGIIGLINLRYLLPGATIDVDGKPTDDLVLRFLACALPLIVSGIGFLMYRAHPPPKD